MKDSNREKNDDLDRKIKEEELRKKKAEADKAEKEVQTEEAKKRKTDAEAEEKKKNNRTKIITTIVGGSFTVLGAFGGIILKNYLGNKKSDNETTNSIIRRYNDGI